MNRFCDCELYSTEFILILFSSLRLNHKVFLAIQDFLQEMCMSFTFSMRATCLGHIILLDLITEYYLEKSTNYKYPH